MPVKVRCPGCGKVVTAPDKAQGRAIRCPDCKGPIRVPAAMKGGKRKKTSRANPLAGVDLSRMEDMGVDVCMKCGTELDEEETECPECGYDSSVGGLGKVATKKRRRGPDPADFYGKAWTESWSFLLENKNLAVKTAFFWTIFGTLAWCSTNMVIWCDRTPPKMFWLGMSTIFTLGIPGWYWFLNGKIIQATMEQRPKIGRIEADFFSSIALGVKSFAWPYILGLPVTVWFMITGATVLILWMDLSIQLRIMEIVAKAADIPREKLPDAPSFRLDPEYAFAPLRWVGGIAVLLSRFCFPIAQVHLNGTHSYKSYLPVDMIVLFFKNIGATLYWLMMWVAVHLPMVIAISLISTLWLEETWIFLMDTLKDFIAWAMEMTDNKVKVVIKDGLLAPDDEMNDGFMFSLIAGSCWMVVIFTVSFLTSLLFAAPSVFMMKANGLFGHYNRDSLALSDNTGANVPAGFWPRWLAYWADFLTINTFFITIRFLLLGAVWFLATLGVIGDVVGLLKILLGITGLSGLISLIIVIGYYVWAESGQAQGTLGKYAMGLIVTDMEGNKITRGQAFGRLFARFLSAPLGFGYIMAAFTKKKQTLHDTITKTQVVWRGAETTD